MINEPNDEAENETGCENYHEDSHLESAYEERTDLGDDDRGWPGDGSGTDDLADYNQNEADDYRDEGREDGAFESSDE